MATINDIGKSLSSLSDDELFDLHRNIRQSRRITKRTTKVSSKPKSKVVDTKKQIEGMSQEARDKLIEELLAL